MSEFSRPISLDTIGAAPKTVEVAATSEERGTLARRFALQDIGRLTACLQLCKTSDGYRATGTISADVIQTCAATFAPVPVTVLQEFTIRFTPEEADPTGEDIELDAEDCDVMTHDGREIDAGEAVAQTLALALDPFPRAADADAMLAQAGVVGDDAHNTGPFSALKALMPGARN